MTNEPAHAASKQAVVPGMHVTKITFESAHVPHNQLLNDYDTSSSAIFHLLHRITKEEKYEMSVQSLWSNTDGKHNCYPCISKWMLSSVLYKLTRHVPVKKTIYFDAHSTVGLENTKRLHQQQLVACDKHVTCVLTLCFSS